LGERLIVSRKVARNAKGKLAKRKIIYYFSALRAKHLANAINPFIFATLRLCVKPFFLNSFVMLSAMGLEGALPITLCETKELVKNPLHN